jgi:hypothetical protein
MVYPGPIDSSRAEDYPLDKVPPSVVADAMIAALEQGIEDVIPDPMAQELYKGYKADAKAVERSMAAQPDAAGETLRAQ